MREVSVFYAYDDTKFYNREECLDYEENILNRLKEINEKYSFFDKNMNLYCAPLESPDIEDWMDWFLNAVDKCEFIHREANLSILTERLITDEGGFCISNKDFGHIKGWFRYNYQTNEWEKVDE